MFYVEQISAFVGVASVCLGAAPSALPSLPCPAPEPSFSLPLASDSADAAQETALGFEFLLYGDETSACRHLTAARTLDPASLLPLVGLALLAHDPTERAAHLDQLRKEMEQAQATPVEAFYLSAFLRLLEGKTAEAAQEFSNRAIRYTRDQFSAAWAILLLHYSNPIFDREGNFHVEYQETLKLAESFFTSAGKEFLPACYLRAIAEESQPEISEKALTAASHFVEQMPDSPVALHLYAHLLYKSGRYTEAADYFHRAYESARSNENTMLQLRARLYESVALWSAKKDKAALAIRRELNAMRYTAETPDELNTFLTWESHTLPLRILVLREKLPTLSELKAALNAAAPQNNRQEIVACAAMCIADTLSARIRFRAGKRAQAIGILNTAEKNFQKWELQETEARDARIILTPFKRLRSACLIAINKAKAEIYPSSSETWEDNLNKTIRQSFQDASLPPVIPRR